MNLTALVLDVVTNSGGLGLNHAQIIRSILERGYEDSDLSTKVHTIVRNLVAAGMISKNHETRIIQARHAY